MTEEQMREVAAIKEKLQLELPDSRDRLGFFNHFLRFYGDTKTPRQLLELAIERDNSLYFRPQGESVAEMYKRSDAEDADIFGYCVQNKALMEPNPQIVILALSSYLDNCRSQQERDFYLAMTPEQLLAIFKADQVEAYGEDALSDPRWDSSFWKRPKQ